MSTTLQKKLSFGISLLACMLVSFLGFSQTAGTAVTMTLTNVVQTLPTEFTYDVMLTNTGTTTLYLRGYSAGINFAAGMAGGGTLTHTFVSRDPLLSTIPSVSPGVNLAVNHFRLTTINANAGSEYLLVAGVPVRLATMKVTNSIAFPANFNPTLGLQTVTGSGKTQCIATCYVGTPVTANNYALNGVLNAPASGTLQVLNGVAITPCFFLNPTGVFTVANPSSSPVACFGQSTGSAQIALSSTGSAAPTGTVGNYTINGGANIAYNGNPFTVSNLSAGIYTISVTTSYGCSGTTVATITQPTAALASSFSASTCAASYTLPWSTSVSTSGIYTHTYITSNGCDSVVTANIVFNSASVNAPTTATACSSYLWAVNGQTYTSSGIYNATFLNAAGCDSNFTLNLTVNAATTNAPTIATACNSYVWSVNGNTYTASGNYVASFLNAAGCDSSKLLNLTINQSSVNAVSSVTQCNSYLWSVNGTTYTASGTYVAPFVNAAGCDSNLTLNLVINQSTASTTTIAVPGSYTWAANGITYTSSGIHTVTLVNAAGCDSVTTLNLTITGASFTLTVLEDAPISCFGNNDGSALAIALPATGTYTYSIDGGPFVNVTGSFTNLTAGVHTICASDGSFTLCDTISFVDPPALTVSFVIDSTVSCFGNDGQISAIIAGGTNNIQPYTTIWTNSNIPPDTLNNQFTNNYDITISNLPVGVYHILVQDDNGCMVSGSTTLGLTPPVTVTASNTAINCFGGSSVISASATGGEGSKVITIGGLPIAASYPAGTYTVTATDAKGCTGTTLLTITQPSAIVTTTSATACNTYTWAVNSITYTASGIYSVTFVSASNCDSVVSLNLTINQSSVNAPAIVNACDSYTWAVNGLTYTTSGIRTATFTNAAGCDSSFVLNLTINTSSTNSTSITAIGSYTWPVNGQTYTVTGQYTNTTLNGNGCVHTDILNLIINNATFYITDTVIQNISCKNNNDGFAQVIGHGGVPPYSYTLDGGVQVNNTGLFHNLTPGVHTVCAISGSITACDTVFITEPDSLLAGFWGNLVSCNGNDGYLEIHIHGGTSTDPMSFNGGVGGVQDYLTWWMNAAGDTLNDVFTDNFAVQVGDTLAPGNYHVRIEDDHGCFYTANVTLGQAPPVTVSATASPIACFGGLSNIIVNGTGGVGLFDTIPPPQPYPTPSTLVFEINGVGVASGTPIPSAPGTYTITATDAKLCSASTVLTITAPAIITTTINQTSCNSYLWTTTGTTYTVTGAYSVTLTSVDNCDSIVTLNLTINHSTINSPVSATACGSFNWIVNNVTYTASGSYTATFLNAEGCDSNRTLNLTILPISSGSSNASACNSYTWNGTTYTVSGAYLHTYTNAAGCDSVHTLNLTINISNSGSISVLGCSPYVWNGNTYTASGAYLHTYTNAAGCDSVVTLNLTIGNNTGSSSLSACNNFTWNGTTYTVSGAYLYTYTNAAGCDSIHTLNLTINQSNTGTITVLGCSPYVWNGSTYTSSGAYLHTYTNAAGCDSVVTMNLTIGNNTGSSSLAACNNFTWNGTTYTVSGAYLHTYTNAAGCDSIHTLNLTINQSNTGTITVLGCSPFVWNGSTYTASGAYLHTYTNAAGCDSVVTMNLTIGNNTGSSSLSACNNFTWNGTTYTVSGAYLHTYTNAAGCDSVHTLNLTINSSNTGATTVSQCGPYVWNGTTYTVSGSYLHTYTNAAGCDSVVTLTLTITTLSGSSSASACNSFVWNGTTYTTSGAYTHTYTNAAGCDSIHTLNLTIGTSNTGSLTLSDCSPYVWNGNTYTANGSYVHTYTNAAGCDSVVTLNLTIANNTGASSAAACDSLSWNGITYTASGVYVDTFTNAAGCDSIHTLTLTVNHAVVNATTAVTGCLYTWAVNGVTYTASGVYTATFQTASGCDSSFTLIVTCPLPVTITRFVGYKGNSKDILEWTTGSEQNNEYFNLQHGTDAINFSTLAKVFSKAPGGNSSIDIDYRAENLKPSLGHNYYRLQQVDLDGHSTYESHIVDLIWDADGNSVTIYPNPTSDVLSIDLYTKEASNTSVKILDMSGRTVKKVFLKSIAGMNNMTISLSELANGLYTVQIFEDDKLSFVEKVRKND